MILSTNNSHVENRESISRNARPVQLKICFVIDDLLSQLDVLNSYVMTAEWMASAGHSVTILSTRSHEAEKESQRKWNSYFKQKGIEFIHLSYQGPVIRSLAPAERSYHILHWMLENASRLHIVHFPLSTGLAYYSLLAKHQSWAFQQIEFCIDSRFSTMWHKHIHKQWIDQVNDLASDFLERECLRLADRMVSHCNDQLDWMKQQEWQFPKKIHVFERQDESEAQYVELHDRIITENNHGDNFVSSSPLDPETDFPLVSICVTHFNRPHFLAQVLESIKAQDYPNFEVILIDDASTLPEAQAFLKSLTKEFESKGWQIIRNQKNLFPGASRNLAARQSRGEYLLFMDDDNYAKSHQVTTFVQVAKRVNADILTCAMDVFEGQNAPSQNIKLMYRFLPMGAAVGVGFYFNLFGDINALIKKNVYEALNGLTEDHGIGGEDWELFGRAVLKGYHLETIPQALFWYRDTPNSITKSTHLHANYLRGMRSYLNAVPSALRGNLLLSQGQQFKLCELMQDPESLARLSKLMQDNENIGKLLKRCWQLFLSRAWRTLCQPGKTFRKIGKKLFKI